MGIHIRDVTTEDRTAVALVRVRSWQHAYAGLVPQSYLDAMSVPDESARLGELIAAGRSGATHLVAERDGAVVGWGCTGPGRDEDAIARESELYTLYVLPEHLSTGVGRALLAELIARASASGSERMRLWVLRENAPARRFYEKAGFAPDGGEGQFEIEDTTIHEVRYARALATR
ncbi:GNAT family N-acetyltransferase [Streptomyces sp. NPDC047315]|uniref:GNAT family N-acetyltransferase n=1 Tax=Streptomyces sp. NPDC047315 TaxID=3155142 RepID=UPI0033EF153B